MGLGITTREDQLAECWRVAVARHAGGTDVVLTDVPGPLKFANLPMTVQSLKQMFRGGVYKMPMKHADTEYFLERIDAELGPAVLENALTSVALHLEYLSQRWNRNHPGLAKILDKWRARTGLVTSLALAEAAFQADVSRSLGMNDQMRQDASANFPAHPAKRSAVVTIFDRNPHVVATALLRAGGVCEGCSQAAPFLRRSDNSPYLEVHHRTPLAEGGLDTVDNAIALCPNCHRKAHYGHPPLPLV
jgi:5-methylcytosine-specific restriction protein A